MTIVKELVNEGFTHREIAKKLGFERKKLVDKLLYIEKRKQEADIPKVRGRKTEKTLQEYKYPNKPAKNKTDTT